MVDCHWLKLPSCNTVTYRKEAWQRGAVIGLLVPGVGHPWSTANNPFFLFYISVSSDLRGLFSLVCSYQVTALQRQDTRLIVMFKNVTPVIFCYPTAPLHACKPLQKHCSGQSPPGHMISLVVLTGWSSSAGVTPETMTTMVALWGRWWQRSGISCLWSIANKHCSSH